MKTPIHASQPAPASQAACLPGGSGSDARQASTGLASPALTHTQPPMDSEDSGRCGVDTAAPLMRQEQGSDAKESHVPPPVVQHVSQHQIKYDRIHISIQQA